MATYFCDLTLEQLATWLKNQGEKEFHAKQIFGCGYTEGVSS